MSFAVKHYILHFNVLTLIVLLLSLPIPAQSKNTTPNNFPEIKFEHLGVEHGLSKSDVYCILQDQNGFMWFGTGDGLNKYDGYKFTIYRNDPNDSLSLSGNVITALYEDHLGELWIGTLHDGLCRYDRNRDSFIRYVYDKNNPNSLCSNEIHSIFESEEKSKYILWIGCLGGLNKYNRESDTFTSYFPDENKENLETNVNEIISITQDYSGKVWIGTWNEGLFYFDSDKDKFIKYIPHPKYSEIFINKFVTKIHASRWKEKNILWMASETNGLYKIDLENDKITQYKYQPDNPASLSDNETTTIYQTDEYSKELWIGTIKGGLNRFDIQTEEFTHYRHQPGNQSSLVGNFVYSIFKDKSGLMWVGTYLGADKFEPLKPQFQTIPDHAGKPEGLSGNIVTAIYESNEGGDQSELWIGTVDGLNRLDRKSGLLTSYKHDPENINSISYNWVLKIIESQSGKSKVLWISTLGGLNKIDPKTKRITRYYISNNDQSHNAMFGLSEDKNGIIWIGTQSTYLYSFDPKTEQFTRHQPYGGPIYTLFTDLSGLSWIGTGTGLYKFNTTTKEETHYRNIEGNLKSISNNLIKSIFEDRSGILWIGTAGGLNKFDRSTETFTSFVEKDGLSGSTINAILEDGQGNLWLSTGKGISKFNPNSETFKNFDATDGLHGNAFVKEASYMNRKGEMFFGGINGLTYFHPDSINDNTYIPPIVLTDFQIFNKTIKPGNNSPLKKQVSEVNEITLSYDQSIFSFEFAALDYHNPVKNKYAYKMEGVDPDWVYTDASRRFATYTQLDPGEYVFHVKGSNNDGIWNEEGTSITVIITPPWWRTNLAYVVYFILGFSLLYSLRRYEINRQKLKHNLELEHVEAEKMHEVDELKSRFFANISHEFRTPLTLIFGPAKDIIEETNESKTKQNAGIIKRNASRLYSLVNQLLDLSKLEAGRMTLETSEQNIIPLLKGLVLSFTSLAERKKITLQFNTIEENLNVYIDTEKVEKIITNLLSNAFKFTPEGGKVDFTVEKMIKDVEIRITDTGIGIPTERIDKIFDRFYQVDGSHTREKEGTGIGLALTKELVELHKGEIKVESKEGEGTTFTVLLSLGKEHLKAEEIVEKEIEEEETKKLDETELIVETESRKEKRGIDSLLDTEKPMLLIVEDNSDVRNYIISHLDEDYRIEEAIDGEDGYNKSIEHIPDLIVSDVMMPKMDGFELCDKVKTDERTSHIPVILLTAKATSKDKIEGYETGADDYIMKPFDAAELKVRIKNLIEIRRKLQEKFSSDDYSIPKELNAMDEQFMKRVLGVINEHISEDEFSIEELGKEAAMSRWQIYKKIRALTGKSPSLFLRSVRLVKAKKMIKEHKGTISEIAYSVGFSSPAYFSKCFSIEFGFPPSEL